MCKNTDENVNPMPTGGDKRGAVVLKSLIGMVALGNCITSTFSLLSNRKGNKHGVDVCDCINLSLTIVDFAFSCGVGYGVYAPMDSSNERIGSSDYKKIIKDTSDAAGLYSDLWMIKTFFSVCGSLPSTILTIADKRESDETLWDLFDGFFTALNIGMCSLSIIFELNACVEAGKVNGDKLNDNQKRDKSCFLCETVGFICDDICAVIDNIVSIGDFKNIPVFVTREAFEAAYAISMFTEAGIINNE